jgi:hypothetical protein
MSTLTTTTRNATIEDLASLLQDQHGRKIDMIVPAEQVRSYGANLVIAGADQVIEDDGVTDPNGTYRPTRVCDEGIASKLGVPLAYLRRLREAAPDLYDSNVNGWLHGKRKVAGRDAAGPITTVLREPDPRSFLLRTFRGDDGGDGVARAFLSNQYRIFDNLDVLTAALEGVREAGVEVEIDGCDLTERRMYVRIKAPAVQALAPTLLAGYRSPFSGNSGDENPVVFAGFVIANSEVGDGAFSITPRIIAEVCDNGMTITRDAMRNVHLGGKLGDGVIQWSDETQRKNLDLVASQARDAVAQFLDAEYVKRAVQIIEAQATAVVDQPAKAIETIGKRLRFGQDRIDGILDHFVRGGQMTAGGVLNAVTSYAQTVEDADDAMEIEAQAIAALDLAAAGSRS